MSMIFIYFSRYHFQINWFPFGLGKKGLVQNIIFKFLRKFYKDLFLSLNNGSKGNSKTISGHFFLPRHPFHRVVQVR